MNNRENKNWNNFALGVLVMILPLLALPQELTKFLIIALGFFIALFSLAQFGPQSSDNKDNEKNSSPTIV
ncbi:hypothetical protein IT398_00960 [Candidatus Nomurabacteria bacterium]|nr:hypothetical protein [Candidatus Nomurabacteria bacterium]